MKLNHSHRVNVRAKDEQILTVLDLPPKSPPVPSEGVRLRIGIVGPISTAPLLPFLDIDGIGDVPPGMGGTSITQLVAGLVTRGASVVVFTVDPTVTEEVILSGERLKICVVPFRNARRARDLFRIERKLLREAIRRENPDVVNAHFTHLYAWAAQESGLPCIVTARDAPFRVVRYINSPYHIVQLFMAFVSVWRSRRLIVNSTHLADHYRKFFRFKGPVTVIPNGFGKNIFDLWNTHQHRDAVPFTFCAALVGWSVLKNGTALLQAFSTLRAKYPETCLRLYGDGFEENGPAQRWARQAGVADGVSFIGSLPQEEFLKQLSQECDVFVHSSLEESFGSAIGEAMAIGLPVIGGCDSGAVPEVLGHGKAGLLVDVRSPHEIAAAMESLLTDRPLFNRLREAAHDAALNRFHIDRIVDQYLEQYDATVDVSQTA